MSITVVKGGISSGKTALCMNMIEKLHKTNRCVILVNDKYSFETEKSFINQFGGTGLNNIEVMTFRKLADKLVDDQNTTYMTEAGKQMLVYRAIKAYIATNPDISTNLLRSVGKDGFADIMTSFINELGNYRTTSDDLREQAENTDDKILKEKLSVIADIYDRYQEIANKMNYTDTNNFLDLLAQKINSNKNLFKGASVFIECFNDFLPPRWNVIKAINSQAERVVITLRVSEREGEKQLYEINEETLRRIEDEYTIEHIECDEHLKHTKDKNKELYHLINTWNTDEIYEGKTDKIRMFKSADTYMEVERVACKITELVREEGYRYRDIAIVYSNEDMYAPIIEPVFNEYEIPYFSDNTELLGKHPVAIQITSVFDMFKNGFDYESVFMYLKSGYIFKKEKSQNGYYYTPFSFEEIDELDNYAVKYGIRGKRRWLEDDGFAKELTIMEAAFEDSKDGAFLEQNKAKLEKINSLHKELMGPVIDFNKKVLKSKTGKDYAKALFDLLDDINIADGLESEIYNLEKENKIDEAQQFERIWELLLEVIEQIALTMGDEEMELEEFGEYVKQGISTCQIRLVPSGIDRVYVGLADNNNVVDVKVLFAMGAMEGTYPNICQEEGFLSDKERDMLNTINGRKMFAETTKERTKRQNYSIFELFAQVSDYLFISMPLFDFSGAEHGVATIVNDIIRKFPDVKISDNFSYKNSEEKFYISSPQATFHKMLINKSSNRKSSSQIWDAVKEYYASNDDYLAKMKLLDGENEFFNVQDSIDSSYAIKLYGEKINYSKSKIDTYAKCPYSFFMQYGLGVIEREEWEISKADLGSYAHEIIEKFCTCVEDGATTAENKLKKWRELDEESRKTILYEIFNKVSERMMSANLTRQAKIEHILGRMNRVIDKATKTITDCFVHGKYTIKSMENEITVPISDSVFINGFIDRLDELKDNGKNSIRVIDYKTGSSEFNIKNIYNGIDMQMVIYALAAKLKCEEDDKEPYTVTGMYYTKLRGELKGSVSDVEKLRKLDGITFEESQDMQNKKVLVDMDDSTKEGYSTILPIKFKNNGELDRWSTEKVRTQYEGEKLMDFVRDKILEFDDNIRNKGDIRIMPYEGACDYCDYSKICSISGAIRKRPQEGKDLKTDEIWKSIVDEQEKKG